MNFPNSNNDSHRSEIIEPIRQQSYPEQVEEPTNSGDEATRKPSENSQPARKRRRSVLAVLIAALLGGVGIGIYAQVFEYYNPQDSMGNFITGSKPASFLSVERGSCVNWSTPETGSLTDFKVVPCSNDHRFELAQKEDLSAYPVKEFGPDAPYPNATRQIELTSEICYAPTVEYLKGNYDPDGKFRITPILPPAADWQRGDRTLLCGITMPDADGISQPIEGKTDQQDQANVQQPGTCVAEDENGRLTTTPCEQDHIIEIVSIVNLFDQFPNGLPSPEDQNKYLSTVCTDAAKDYIGGDDNLYNSTLIPFWETLDSQSWSAGSHAVNCSLIKPNEDGRSFSTLTGSAKSSDLKINGQAPPPQPERNPLRPEGE